MIRTLNILHTDTELTKLFTAITAGFAAIGLFMRGGIGDDLKLLLDVFPSWGWQLLASYLCVSRLVGLFIWPGNVITQIGTPLVGIVFWAWFFAGSFVAPGFGMGMLFAVPALQESLLLGRAIRDRKRRK